MLALVSDPKVLAEQWLRGKLPESMVTHVECFSDPDPDSVDQVMKITFLIPEGGGSIMVDAALLLAR